MIIMKIYIIQNLLTKQYLNGRHHYRSMIWVNANICVLEASKRSLNSNKTLLKTNESKWWTYWLNHMSAWWKLNHISVVPILMMNLSHLVWPSALWYPILIFTRLCFVKFPAEIISTIIKRCSIRIIWHADNQHHYTIWTSFVNGHFPSCIQWKWFSVPLERHALLKSHDIIVHASFHWHHKCHYEKLDYVIVMMTWSWTQTLGEKKILDKIISCNISWKKCYQSA